jgi:hypothetical protein
MHCHRSGRMGRRQRRHKDNHWQTCQRQPGTVGEARRLIRTRTNMGASDNRLRVSASIALETILYARVSEEFLTRRQRNGPSPGLTTAT